jgi:transposase-like protein
MENESLLPKTLLEAVRYFSNPDVGLGFMASLRWPNGVTCPHCDHTEVMFLKTRRIWKCKSCRKQFTIKTGTIMEDSPIKLDKWLPAIWLIVNAKNGISSYEVHRALGVTQKTAWFLMHRIRLAMQAGTFQKLSGSVEVDETFIGGLARNMHKDKRGKLSRNGILGKVAVMGLLERHGEVRTVVLDGLTQGHLQPKVRQHVEEGANVYSDAHGGYTGLNSDYIHNVINHAETYVIGHVHTNGIENYWSLLKRTIKGTYVSVESFHLFRYLDEQSFRFNKRKATDLDRFIEASKTVTGRRLTFDQLTGKTGETERGH